MVGTRVSTVLDIELCVLIDGDRDRACDDYVDGVDDDEDDDADADRGDNDWRSWCRSRRKA